MNWFKNSGKETRRSQVRSANPRCNLVVEALEERTLLSTVGLAEYLQLPLSFEANQGQMESQVQFLSRGQGYSLFLTPTEAVLSLNGAAGGSVLRTQLVGGNPDSQAAGLDKLPGISNYFIGNDPSKWQTNIAQYGRVQYKDVYSGVDLVYYGTNQRQLEYDFVVAPGADPNVIQLDIQGAQSLSLDAHGNLVLHTGSGDVIQNAPIIYQETGGGRQVVAGSFVLLGDSRVGFQIGAYDTSKTLTIDPVLIYSTYLGGNTFDTILDMAVDGVQNVYVTGYTSSPDFPVIGGLPFSQNGTSDAFVTKLNAAGTALVYSTYLGGSGTENDFGVVASGFAGIAVNGLGEVFITGMTTSADFPVMAPLQAALNGTQDAFVTKLNATGSALMYSTFLGGSGTDAGDAIAVDSANNAYITGVTGSADFVVVGGVQGTTGGLNDVFISKLNAVGGILTYSTYLGGSGEDFGQSIVVDAANQAFVTGRTLSADFPTAGGLDTTLGGSSDAFVANLNAVGGALIYSTYLGGSGDENSEIQRSTNVGALALDTLGSVYVTGSTASADFLTVAPIDAALSGTWDAYVAKLSTTGTTVYATYLGGTGDDFGMAIAVDSSRQAYVTGYTLSADFPTASPSQAALDGTHDAFVTRINAAGTIIGFSTYLGGTDGATDGDIGRAIAVDASNQIYVGGFTDSLNFPTQLPFQATLSGATAADGFITKIGIEGITLVNAGGLILAEGGATDTFTVVLNTQPSANVLITMTSAAGQTTVAPVSPLTFTSLNWNTVQTVTVTAVNDAIDEASPHNGVISFSVTSGDLNYNAFPVASLTAQITDNDIAGVTIAPTTVNVTEGGATGTYTVVLTSQPTMNVNVTLTPNAQVTVAPVGPLVFTAANWNVAQTVTVTAVDDASAEASPHPGIIAHTASSTDPNYNPPPAITNVTAQITDNDAPGVSIVQSGGTTAVVENGAADTYTLVLTTMPAADVVITLTNPDTQLNFAPTTITFTAVNYNIAQTVTITAIDDSLAQGNRVRTISATAASVDANYNTPPLAIPDVSVSITEDDLSGLVITPTTISVVEGGGASTYTVVLQSQPTAAVTVVLTPDAQVTAITSPLLFTTLNWNVPQVVSVSAVDDSTPEGTHVGVVANIASSTDPNYNATVNVTANITDNDLGVVVVQSGGSTDVAEGGVTDTFTLNLNAMPTANVTIFLDGGTQLSVTPTSVVFTAADWNVPQVVTVSAIDDTVVEGIHTGNVTLRISTTDSSFNGISVPDILVNITDNDLPAPGLVVSPSGGGTTVAEGGATDTLALSLTTPPTADVTITLLPDAQLAAAPSVLIFTATNWNLPQIVIVSAVDDSAAEGTHSGTIDFTSASTDTTYDLLGISAVTATILDNDTAGISIVTSGPLDIAEGGASGSYTVALTAQPSADVVLTLNPDSQVNVAPTTLTFTAANWDITQIVTVTAVDDTTAEGNHLGIIGHTATSTDLLFNSISLPSVVANITDDDTPATIVRGTSLNDAFLVTSSGSTVVVTLNGKATSYPGISQLSILALAGDDTIQVNTALVPVIVDGDLGTDKFLVNGQAAFNTFRLGTTAVRVNGTDMSFTNMENLIASGKSNTDTFIVDYVPTIPMTVTFKGDAGTDILMANSSANNWKITAANTGTLNGTVQFSAIESLTGGADADSFTLSAGRGLSGQLDGGGGDDTVDYSQYLSPMTVNLQTGIATNLKAISNVETIIGGKGADSVTGANRTNLWSITASNTIRFNNAVNLRDFETILGGTQEDTVRFVDGATITGRIDGGAGRDSLDYSAYTTAVTINLQAKTATATSGASNFEDFTGGSAVDSLIALNKANIWSLTGLGAGILKSGTNLSFLGVENLTGGTLTDSFQNAGTWGGSWTGLLTGGAGKDSLTAAASDHVWNLTAADAGTLDGAVFASVESLVGNAGVDAFQFAAGAKVSGSLNAGAGVDQLDLSALAAAVTVNLQTNQATATGGILGFEQFIGTAFTDNLIAFNRINTWFISGPNSGGLNGTTFASFENLTGGSVSDTFSLGTTGSWSGILNGGPGSDTLIASPSNANYVTAGATAGTLNGNKYLSIEKHR